MSAFSVLEDSTRSIYWPSLVCNFQLRLDEGAGGIPGAVTAEELNEKGGASDSADEPAVLAIGSDDLSQIVGVVPKSASVELPGYRQAGQFSIELEFRDLPLDPRVVRALGVAIHLGAVAPHDFAEGMTSAPLLGDSRFEKGTRRTSIIQTTPENIILAGLADSITTEHSSRGAIVRIEGRDLRGILLDTPIPANILQNIDLQKPIDEVVKHITANLHPSGKGIQVDVDASEWPDGTVPKASTQDDVTRVNLDAEGKSLRAQVKGEAQELNYWDLITRYCFLVGAVPYFVGSRIRIRPSRTIFDVRSAENTFDPNFPTPFAGGQPRNLKPPVVSKAEQIQFRRLTFGRDIQSLTFERKLGGVKVPVVRCVSYDTSGNTRGKDRLLVVQAPPAEKDAARTTSTGAGGKTPQTDSITVKVPGIRNKQRLQEIAEGIRQEIGRQEVGGSVETKSLSSFGGSNQDPDLLRLRPGDPVEFRVDASGMGVFPPPISPLTDADGRSFEEQVKEVTSRVGDEKLARVLVSVNRGKTSSLTKQFRVANVRFDWNATSGIGIAFDFQNFVEARYAVETVAEATTIETGVGIA